MAIILDLIIRICNRVARHLFLRKLPAVSILPLATIESHREGIIWPSPSAITGIIWTPSKYRWPQALHGTTIFRRLLARTINTRQAPQVPQDHHEADAAASPDSLSHPNPTTQAAKPASSIVGDQASLPLPVSGLPFPGTPQEAPSQLYDPASPPTPVLRPLAHPPVLPSAPKASTRSQEPIAATIAVPQQSPRRGNEGSNGEVAVSWLSVLCSAVRAVWAWLRSWFATRRGVGEEGRIFHVSELREILVR